MPATPGVQKIKLTMQTQASMSQSPFTGSEQVFEWPAEWWLAEVTLPPMKRAAAEPWLAFFAALRGRSGTFLLGDTGAKVPQGPVGAAATIYNAPAGKILSVTSTGVAQGNVAVKAGDYVQVGWGVNATRIRTSGGSVLSKYVFDAGVSDSGGIYNTSIRLHNWGANAVVVSDNLGGTQTIAAGADVNVLLNGSVGDGVTHYQLVFAAQSAGNTLDFIVWAPRMQHWYADENLVSIASQTFTTSWAAVSGATITLNQNYNQRIYKAAADAVVVNGTGRCPIEVFPRLRADAMLDNDPITFTNCKGLFRLAANQRGWDLDEALIYGIQFQAIEAI